MVKQIHGLYAITDRRFYRGRSLEEVAGDWLAGGVTCIQLREKDLNTRELLEAGRVLRRMTRAAGALLIVNDRVDVAMALDADGVHLGQGDLPIRAAREILGEGRIIGVSTHNVEEAREAAIQGANYIGVGPMRATTTKTDTKPVVGIAGLRRIRQAVDLPIIAIGGIRLEDAEELAAAGADGLAVIRGLVDTEDILERAKAFVQAILRGRQRREGRG
ncbi:thiamine phosphate synthase [Kyrpidia tusciae]|uniref:Thiamine-phosphate synthase n=1 Tax=Kyrpidia tusciae (strain DSM 2912 / NBRC 15312 / T2) TaxID=562970 RepID=D5WQ99_KYRT2|nr:thiamine phosphate synthase [Kyrpidia tusciae]ADG06508.1 thiamine-phosphate pyrophosphorylase [Kyrpidia tusciae DSM 2912]